MVVISFGALFAPSRPKMFVLGEETPVSIGHAVLGSRSTDVTPVDILSYGVHFRIPRNYIDIIDGQIHSIDFRIVTLYPGFLGVQAGAEDGVLTEQNKIWRWKYSPNLIYISSEGGGLAARVKDSAASMVFASEDKEPDHPWKYGLLRSGKSSASQVMNVYFTRPNERRTGVVVFCSRDSFANCWEEIRVSDTLLMHVEYHVALLPHWATIDQKADALIKSFRVR